MISASATLASIFTTIVVVLVAVDGEHRVRPDRINEGPHRLWKARENGFRMMLNWLETVFCSRNSTKWSRKRTGGIFVKPSRLLFTRSRADHKIVVVKDRNINLAYQRIVLERL